VRTEGDVGVVGIVGHIGCDEGPLGQLPLVQVVVKRSEVLDQAQSSVVAGNLVKDDQRVVLAHIIIRICLLVGIVVALEAWIGHILLVLAP